MEYLLAVSPMPASPRQCDALPAPFRWSQKWRKPTAQFSSLARRRDRGKFVVKKYAVQLWCYLVRYMYAHRSCKRRRYPSTNVRESLVECTSQFRHTRRRVSSRRSPPLSKKHQSPRVPSAMSSDEQALTFVSQHLGTVNELEPRSTLQEGPCLFSVVQCRDELGRERATTPNSRGTRAQAQFASPCRRIPAACSHGTRKAGCTQPPLCEGAGQYTL